MVSTWMTAGRMVIIPFDEISLRWKAEDNSSMTTLVLHQQFGDIENNIECVCKRRDRVSNYEIVGHSSQHCLLGYRTVETQWNLVLLWMSYQTPLETLLLMSIFVCTVVEQEKICVNGVRMTLRA